MVSKPLERYSITQGDIRKGLGDFMQPQKKVDIQETTGNKYTPTGLKPLQPLIQAQPREQTDMQQGGLIKTISNFGQPNRNEIEDIVVNLGKNIVNGDSLELLYQKYPEIGALDKDVLSNLSKNIFNGDNVDILIQKYPELQKLRIENKGGKMIFGPAVEYEGIGGPLVRGFGQMGLQGMRAMEGIKEGAAGIIEKTIYGIDKDLGKLQFEKSSENNKGIIGLDDEERIYKTKLSTDVFKSVRSVADAFMYGFAPVFQGITNVAGQTPVGNAIISNTLGKALDTLTVVTKLPIAKQFEDNLPTEKEKEEFRYFMAGSTLGAILTMKNKKNIYKDPIKFVKENANIPQLIMQFQEQVLNIPKQVVDLPGYISSGVKNTAGFITEAKRGINTKVKEIRTGLDADTSKAVQDNPYSKEYFDKATSIIETEGLTPGKGADKVIAELNKELAGDIQSNIDEYRNIHSDTGPMYDNIRKTGKNLVFDGVSEKISSFLKDNDIVQREDGSYDFGQSRFQGNTRAQKQILNAIEISTKDNNVDISGFLNKRRALDDAANREGKPTEATSIIKSIRGIVDGVAREQYGELKDLDNLWVKQKNELDSITDSLVYKVGPKKGQYKDNFVQTVKQLRSEGKINILEKLEQIMPGIKERVDAIGNTKSLIRSSKTLGAAKIIFERATTMLGGALGGWSGLLAGYITGVLLENGFTKMRGENVAKILEEMSPTAKAKLEGITTKLKNKSQLSVADQIVLDKLVNSIAEQSRTKGLPLIEGPRKLQDTLPFGAKTEGIIPPEGGIVPRRPGATEIDLQNPRISENILPRNSVSNEGEVKSIQSSAMGVPEQKSGDEINNLTNKKAINAPKEMKVKEFIKKVPKEDKKSTNVFGKDIFSDDYKVKGNMLEDNIVKKYKLKGLTKQEIDAINNYTISSELDVNNKYISSGLEKLDDYKGTVYRGDDVGYLIEGKKVGDKITTDRLLSTEINKNYYNTSKIKYEILSKKGKNLGELNNKEKEVLFNKGTNFIIRRITKNNDGTIYVKLEEK